MIELASTDRYSDQNARRLLVGDFENFRVCGPRQLTFLFATALIVSRKLGRKHPRNKHMLCVTGSVERQAGRQAVSLSLCPFSSLTKVDDVTPRHKKRLRSPGGVYRRVSLFL
jgi:hypothetical protein